MFTCVLAPVTAAAAGCASGHSCISQLPTHQQMETGLEEVPDQIYSMIGKMLKRICSTIPVILGYCFEKVRAYVADLTFSRWGADSEAFD